MAQLKVYATGNSGYLTSDEIREALELPRHIRQVQYIVIAATKKAAVGLMDEENLSYSSDLTLHQRWPLGDSVRDVATGVPGVYACGMTGTRGNSGMVEIRDRKVRRIGRVVSDWSGQRVEVE